MNIERSTINHLQTAFEFFLFKKFLGVEMIITDFGVFDTVHQGQAFGAVDGFGTRIDELLGVAREVPEPSAFPEYPDDALSGESGFILQVGNDIGQHEIILMDYRIGGRAGFLSLHPFPSDGDIRLSKPGAGFGDRR